MFVIGNAFGFSAVVLALLFRRGRVDALDAEVPVLLAHEMIGTGGQDRRHGCEFASFFSCVPAAPSALGSAVTVSPAAIAAHW